VTRLLNWINTTSLDRRRARPGASVVRHLHPFDDGTGRIARAIGDLLLAPR
jgi:fido (protein-threonine AMPylation protein)